MTIGAFMKVMLAGVCAILALPVIGALMGRPSLGLWYEIAVYVGAPLRNLNTFLSDPANYSVRHASTLYYFLGDFSQFFKSFISIEAQKFPSKWQFLRDRTLGNVYTNYGLFWYDLAGWGVLIYVSVMALLFRILYRNLLSVKEIGSIKGMLFVVLYVYFYSTLVFAFFGNRFYSQFFSLYTVKFVIATITVALFIMRVRVSVEGKALT